MKITIKHRKRAVISPDSVAIGLFVIFYSYGFFAWLSEQILAPIGLASFSENVLLLILYVTLFLLCVCFRDYLRLDFFALLALLILFLVFTYLFHPEYEYVYTRKQYGVLEYVLFPANGIYAYLFVRLVNNPQNLLKGLRIGGYFTYIYSGLRLYIALKRGYWIEENYLGQEIHLSYNLNFGYGLVIFICYFLYCALKNKSVKDGVLAGVGIMMVLIGGSRGPLLNIAIFLAIYILLTTSETKNKIIYFSLIVICTLVFLMSYRIILSTAVNILETFNLPSRTIMKLLEGSISEDSGRNVIWSAAINMIKENPFGYGAMGARHVIYQIHIVGHPHNFFLEILIDYGVIFGVAIILILFLGAVRIFFDKNIGEWRYVFLIFFAYACQLLTSYTYWHSMGLWGALAVAVSINRTRKIKRIQGTK